MSNLSYISLDDVDYDLASLSEYSFNSNENFKFPRPTEQVYIRSTADIEHEKALVDSNRFLSGQYIKKRLNRKKLNLTKKDEKENDLSTRVEPNTGMNNLNFIKDDFI